MFETLFSSSYSFWVVALLIVVLDSALLLAPNEFAFAFGRRGEAKVRITITPFVVRNKELVLALVSFFARPFFVSSVNVADVGQTRLAELQALASRQRSFGVYAVVAMVSLFVAGPVLTMFVGIGHAMLFVLPVVYANAAAALTAIAIDRRALHMPLKKFLYVAFEFIVCPALVANLNKRLIDRGAIVPNTFQLVGDDETARARIKSNLAYHDLTTPAESPTERG